MGKGASGVLEQGTRGPGVASAEAVPSTRSVVTECRRSFVAAVPGPRAERADMIPYNTPAIHARPQPPESFLFYQITFEILTVSDDSKIFFLFFLMFIHF